MGAGVFFFGYDVERAIADMDREGLFLRAPCWYRITKHVIRTAGSDSFVQVLTRAHVIYLEETWVDVWQGIPEWCWERALEELGIE